MPPYDLRARCSRYFTFAELIECGDTWRRLRSEGAAAPNLPALDVTWEGIARLAEVVLDPLHERFGRVEITYGFAGPSLTRHIRAGIAPTLDQHAGSELSPRGAVLCDRGGQACDLRVPGVSAFEVARWVRGSLPFDRMYLYGEGRPLHVSVGPTNGALAYAMVQRARRVVPRALRDDGDWRGLETTFTAAATADGVARRPRSG